MKKLLILLYFLAACGSPEWMEIPHSKGNEKVFKEDEVEVISGEYSGCRGWVIKKIEVTKLKKSFTYYVIGTDCSKSPIVELSTNLIFLDQD